MATKRTTRKTRQTKKSGSKKVTSRKATAKPAPKQKRSKTTRNPRLPAIGTVMKRTFKGKELSVKVLEDGFEYEGDHYRSLSGLARHIVGYQISGPVFFKLTGEKSAAKES